MIGKLTGKIAEKSSTGIFLDVNGVGYDVSLPLSTLATLAATGETASFYIHTYVREDELRLFGFQDRRDLQAFRTMLGISGVGPKLALTIIGALSGDQLARAVERKDTVRLVAIPGIGKKTAERIILELDGKLKVLPGDTKETGDIPLLELASALKNLGFRPAQVDQVINTLRTEEGNLPFETLLRKALVLLQERA